jgi:hypothetical protein
MTQDPRRRPSARALLGHPWLRGGSGGGGCEAAAAAAAAAGFAGAAGRASAAAAAADADASAGSGGGGGSAEEPEVVARVREFAGWSDLKKHAAMVGGGRESGFDN